MSYVGKIIALMEDGETVDDSRFADGIITPSDLRYTLAAFGGCRGGELTVFRQSNRAFDLRVGQWIAAYYDDATLNYKGRIVHARREIGANAHRYELESAWMALESVAVLTRATLGSEGDLSSYDTPRKIIKWLLDTHIVPAQIGIIYDADDLVEEFSPIKYAVLEKGASLMRFIEQMAVLASGSARYFAGVRPDGYFYFKPIDADEIVQTFTVGADVVRSRERDGRDGVINRVRMVGGIIQGAAANNGLTARRIFSHATSIAANGARPINIARFPALSREDDLERAANGIFTMFAEPKVVLESVRRANAEDDGAIEPWRGVAQYVDASRGGEIAKDFIGTADVHLGAYYDYECTIGAESLEAEGMESAIFETQDPEDERYPDVSDEINPPSGWVEGTGGEGGGGGETDPGLEEGPAVGVVSGTIIEFVAPLGAAAGDDLYWTVIINNGGVVNDPSPAPIDIFIRVFNDYGVEVHSETLATARVYASGNVESWRTTVPYTPMMQCTIYARARSRKIGIDPPEYYWAPTDDANDFASQLRTRVLTQTIINETNINIEGGWIVGGWPYE